MAAFVGVKNQGRFAPGQPIWLIEQPNYDFLRGFHLALWEEGLQFHWITHNHYEFYTEIGTH